MVERERLIGLDTTSDFVTIARAVHGGIAMAAVDCHDAIGERPDEVRPSGGVSRSPVLRKHFASALAIPARVVERDEAGVELPPVWHALDDLRANGAEDD